MTKLTKPVKGTQKAEQLSVRYSEASSRRIRLVRNGAPPAITVIVVLAIWEATVRLVSIPAYLLPPPTAIVNTMFSRLGFFMDEGGSTLWAVILGFLGAVAVSLPLAVAMVYSTRIRQALYPLVIAAQVVPKVALAPLFIIWLGFGLFPKVVMVVLITFFPLIVDTVVGLNSARAENLMLVRSMGASRWQAFWKVRWPWALPSVFAGAKVGITLALIGAVVAELFGSNRGLGVVLVNARGVLDTVTVFAAIGWLSIMGYVLFMVVAGIERIATPHHQSTAARRNEMSGGL